MENDAQRRELSALARAQEDKVTSVLSLKTEAANEHLEQIQALEEENTELRRQLADLGAALCTGGPAKDL